MSRSLRPNLESLALRFALETAGLGVVVGTPSTFEQWLWLKVQSSTATHGDTSATLELRLRVTGLVRGLVIFRGTHLSPYMVVMTRPTNMSLGLALEEQGSTRMVLPGDTGVLLGSFPHTRCSCCGRSVTAWGSLTVPIKSGGFSPLHLTEQDIISRRILASV